MARLASLPAYVSRGRRRELARKWDTSVAACPSFFLLSSRARVPPSSVRANEWNFANLGSLVPAAVDGALARRPPYLLRSCSGLRRGSGPRARPSCQRSWHLHRIGGGPEHPALQAVGQRDKQFILRLIARRGVTQNSGRKTQPASPRLGRRYEAAEEGWTSVEPVVVDVSVVPARFDRPSFVSGETG